MISIKLTRSGWKMATCGNVTSYVRGQAHLGNMFLDTEGLAQRFLLNSNVNDFKDLVKELNGTWAAVVQTQNAVFCATDHVRSIQIMYRIHGDSIFVFDDINDCIKNNTLPFEFDEDCVHEYLSSGYVYRNRTLFKEVYSLQAAEYLVVCKSSDGHITQTLSRYWLYVTCSKKTGVQADSFLFQRIDAAFISAMRRLCESIGDRRIVVPLSGGYDSRLIVNYLYKSGFRNVLCYSYGAKDNGESICSRDVALRLGYEWHFVEYTQETREYVLTDPSMDSYFLYMANAANRPCTQEYIALTSLLDQGAVTKDDVIVPGYFFDMLAGSKTHFYTNWCNVSAEVYTWENNFFPNTALSHTLRAIQAGFDECGYVSSGEFYEGWNWQERIAKFIVNNVRSFEALGLDWRLPLCDRELFETWILLPASMRCERRYFREIYPQLAVPEIRDCAIHGEAFGEKTARNRIRHFLKNNIPVFWRYYVRSLFGRLDVGKNSCVMRPLEVNFRKDARKVANYFGGQVEKRLAANDPRDNVSMVTMKIIRLMINALDE